MKKKGSFEAALLYAFVRGGRGAWGEQRRGEGNSVGGGGGGIKNRPNFANVLIDSNIACPSKSKLCNFIFIFQMRTVRSLGSVNLKDGKNSECFKIWSFS